MRKPSRKRRLKGCPSVAELISSVVDFARDIVGTLGYPGVFFAAVLENFFPPLPSEVIFPFVGFVAGLGELNLLGAIVAGVLGALVGAAFWYILGYVLGRANLKIYVDRYGRALRISFEDIEKAEEWFARHEGPAVFFGRLVPLVRTLISVPAGFVRMSKMKFLAYTFSGSFLWIGALSTAGFFLGERWEEVSQIVGDYELLVGLLLVSITLVLLFRFYRRRS